MRRQTTQIEVELMKCEWINETEIQKTAMIEINEWIMNLLNEMVCRQEKIKRILTEGWSQMMSD